MSTTYTLRHANPAKTRADVVVLGVLKTEQGPVLAPGADEVAEAFGKRWVGLLSTMSVTGKECEIVKIPTAGTINSPLLVLVGLGAEATQVALRKAAGAAARAISNATSVAVALPAGDAAQVAAVTEGWLLGAYKFTSYQKKPTKADEPGTVSVLSTLDKQADVVAAFENAQAMAAATAGVRDWVNTPPADLTPPAFADSVTTAVADLTKALRKQHGKAAAVVTLDVLDEVRLAELNCGGVLAVGAASVAPPRMVRLEYAPADAVAHLSLVGKGVTFDTGGLSIKPAQNMHEMKSDMAGAATVIQATFLIARLGLPVRVTTFAPMAENMLSGTAYRPGDVLTMHDGQTVEIRNTDAEGRLLLADALAMAAEGEPDVILDVATLTGAMMVALGDKVTGVLGSDDVVDQVLAAADAAGESMWPMPITDEMDERLKASKIADLLQHDWTRWGGALFAAAFLREFTKARPWAHLDIAGPAYNSGSASGHLTPGGTGASLATLVEFARRMADTQK